MSRRGAWLVPVLSGAVAGMAGSWLLHRWDAQAPAHATQAVGVAPGGSREPPSGEDRASSERLHAAGQVLSNLAQSWPTPSASTDRAPAPEHPSEEARRAQLEREVEFHSARLANLRARPRVPSVARPMERRIEGLFHAPLPGYGMRYESAECRGDSCAVTLSWASREQAQGEMQSAMARAISLPCARELVLPPAAPARDRYEATMLLDCEAAIPRPPEG
jgi:hypothetical protein